jgi:hypothetical protein
MRVKIMIVHAPHGTFDKPIAEFQIDSGTLFDGLTLITREMVAWTYVKPSARKCNKHGAVTALYNHYLGLHNFNNQAPAAEDVLNKATNQGRMSDDPDMLDMDTPTYDMYEDDDEGAYSQVPEFDDVCPDTYNCYVITEVELPIGDKVMSGKVKRRKREHDGSLKGTEHPNPMLDIHMYEVELPDRQVAEYSANVIAENMYTQCNAEGNQYLLLDKIINWRRDNNATDARDDMYVYSLNNNQQYQKTMKGWKLSAK